MNHHHMYWKIISYFRKRQSSVGELHHIIPRSLGGNDEQDNIIRLPLRVHYVCHKLLIHMYEGKSKAKMVYALWMMSNQSKRQITSIQYELARKQFSIQQSKDQRKRTLKQIENGTHVWSSGKLPKLINQKRIANKTHNFLYLASKRVKDGTHNFFDKNAASIRNKKRVEKGIHVFQNKSKEHIKKIAKANSKQVAQISKKSNKTIAIFSSVREACESTGISHIDTVARGIRRSAGGFFWRYCD